MDLETADLEEQILQLSRNGLHEELAKTIQTNPDVNLNCQGKNKSNKTWTPLHLATYFGHKSAVEVLLENKANPDLVNQTGDTPLHKAALTSREEMVMCLLQNNASASIKNDEGFRPSQIACDPRIKNVLEAAEKGEWLKLREVFVQSVKEGKVDEVKDMISRNLVQVNVADDLGNTALHHAAMRDLRTLTVALLQCGADPSKTNNNGERAVDLCPSQQMRRLLDVRPLRSNWKYAKRFEGPLMKGKRFIGRRWFWVVLDRGVISFYRRRADAGLWTKRKSFNYLTEASVTVLEDNHFGFKIDYFDGTYHRLMVNQETNPLLNRQKWVDALLEHIQYSNHFVADQAVIEDDDCDEDKDRVTVVDVKNSVQSAQASHQVLKAQIEEMSSLLRQYVSNKPIPLDYEKLSALFIGKCHKILSTSSEMSQIFSDCLNILEQHELAREAELKEEKEKNRVLEQALQALAAEHHNLEQTITHHGSPTMPVQPVTNERRNSYRRKSGSPRSPSSIGNPSEDDEFYDAISGESDDENDMSLIEAGYDASNQTDRNGTFVTSPSTSSQLSQMSVLEEQTAKKEDIGKFRSKLPVPMFSREEFSIWHILRQCIGKELSKITMPVIFNEPLSFIQRLCEYMEYCLLVEKACELEDSLNRIEYVAAFAVSALASQLDRLGKPFNPLLGETYENQRDDLGFHWVSEQVSHHPPVSAFYAKGTNPNHPFLFHGSIYPKLKFWGKSVEIEPRGTVVLKLIGQDEFYTWSNPKVSVHNIVVGKLWMEQHGNMEVTNHKSKERCVVTFKSHSWFRNDLNKVEGVVYNSRNEPVRHLLGDWTKYVYSLSKEAYQSFVGRNNPADSNNRKKRTRSHSSSSTTDDMLDILVSLSEETDCVCLWNVQPRPEISAQMYNMTQFAMTLNEDVVDNDNLPPTDSRIRPDIRSLENGDIDGASEQKHRLEEKQRAARKARAKKKADWLPRWFVKESFDITGTSEWLFNENYFKRDWSTAPDIF